MPPATSSITPTGTAFAAEPTWPMKNRVRRGNECINPSGEVEDAAERNPGTP
jgi:hypothetical protein